MPHDRDPFANFERMRRDIDELLGDVFQRSALGPHRRAGFSPPVDVSYADDPPRAVITAALPGIRLDELQLEIRERELHIAGYRRPTETEGRVYQQIEIEHGPFHRVIQLGTDVVSDTTRATFENGMLRVELPLADPKHSRRTVPIRVGSDIEATPPGGDPATPAPVADDQR